MGKKPRTKKAARTAPSTKPACDMYVFGLDGNGKPKGARFAEIRDNIVIAATDMGLRRMLLPPEEFSAVGMKLPLGRIFGSGKAFVPHIRRDLYDRLVEVADKVEADEAKRIEAAAPELEKRGRETLERIDKGIIEASTLPRSFEEIALGHMVLVHEGPGEGWWEAVVVSRDNDLLTVRYRDYPTLPTFTVHRSSLAIVNPGSA